MAWKGKRKVPGRFADLLDPLMREGLQQKQPVLFQVLSEIIKRSNEVNQDSTIQLADIIGRLTLIDNSIVSIDGILSLLTDLGIVTSEPIIGVDLDNFPNFRELLPGTGITFDDTVDNERTINASATGGGYWTPLTDGDLDETDLIFASGEAIAVFVPV